MADDTALNAQVAANGSDTPAIGELDYERFAQLADNIPESFWLVDVKSRRVVYANRAYEMLWGGRIEELYADRRDWLRHVHEDDRAHLADLVRRYPFGGVTENFRVAHVSGQVRWLQLRSFNMCAADGSIEGVGGIATDITEFVTQREALQKNDQELRRFADVQKSILDALPAGIALLDDTGHIVAVNDAWVRFLPPDDSRNQLLGIGSNYLAVCESSDSIYGDASACQALRDVSKGINPSASFVYHCPLAGQDRWFRAQFEPLGSGASRGVVVIHVDVTDNVQAERRLFQLAHNDSLTGLPNRLLFLDRLHAAMALAKRNASKLAVLFVDLDRFKIVNDTLGHHAGDQLLQEVGTRIVACLRESDTVGRLGGDEFGIVLPDLRDGEDAAVIARKVLEVLVAAVDVADQKVYVGASIGIALFPDDAADVAELNRNADAAMYRAKEMGRNNFQFYTATMNARAMERLRLDTDLRQALVHGEFELYYQPKVSCASGAVVGVEALLRWNHPKRGLVSPIEFIPVLEETGLISAVGEWVLNEACRQLRCWMDAGYRDLSMAVNLSARQFDSGKLVDGVRLAIEKHGLPATKLDLELTESLLLKDADEVIRTLNELRRLGVTLSVDDFGTGYSSLSYLKRFPIDAVKIDRSFVQDITADPEDSSITRAVVTMAHNLKLKVIAEGVETEGQLAVLVANQCDEIQGYLFSRPLPATDITAMLQEGRCLSREQLHLGKRTRTLLLVDDEEGIISAIKRILRKDGYRILTANNGQAGLEVLAQHSVDVILSDQRMPGMTGVEFLRRVKTIHPETVRIVLSGYTELQSITDAINEGAIYKFLTKPWDDGLLRANIEEAFRYKELADENRLLSRQIQVANKELAEANQKLSFRLEEKHLKLLRDEATLGIAQEMLQRIPAPTLGLDDDGMVVFANEAAESVFEKDGQLLGMYAADVLPASLVVLINAADNTSVQWRIGKTGGLAVCRVMGEHSSSRGRLIVLLPEGELS